MEQTLPLNEAAAPRKKHPCQIIAAVLFTLFMIVSFANVLGITLSVVRTLPLSEIEGMGYVGIISGILFIAAFAMLIPLAANKATKNAAILLIVNGVLSILVYTLRDVLHVFGSLDLEINGSTYSVFYFIWPLVNILGVYAFSLILRNNRLDRGVSWWIALLAISYGVELFWNLWSPIAGLFDPNYTLWPGNTIACKIFDLLFSILLVTSYIKLARCAAFAGKESAPQLPEKAYSPLNKYMAALLITPAVLILFLWLHVRFLAPVLNSMMGY